MGDKVTHNEDTLMKAAEAARSVVGIKMATEVITAMQNAGILLRERA